MDVLNVAGISKKIGKRQILKDLSFKIEEGEIVGFVGPNGAGKTMTLRIITGMVRPGSGDVKVCGFSVKTARREAVQKMVWVIENPAFYNSLSGKANIQIALGLRGLTPETYRSIVGATGFPERISEKVGKYSLGMKQRLMLAISIWSGARLLLLDEPTNGLDPTGILELRASLRETVSRRRQSVLISSHHLTEIEEICDRVVFIDRGKIIRISRIERGGKPPMVTLEVDDSDAAGRLLDASGLVQNLSEGESRVSFSTGKDDFTKVLRLLLEHNIAVRGIDRADTGMEQAYQTLYMRDKNDSPGET